MPYRVAVEYCTNVVLDLKMLIDEMADVFENRPAVYWLDQAVVLLFSPFVSEMICLKLVVLL
jgi:hypothetical protein